MNQSEFRKIRRAVRAFYRLPANRPHREESRSARGFIQHGEAHCPALDGLTDREVEAVRSKPASDFLQQRDATRRSDITKLRLINTLAHKRTARTKAATLANALAQIKAQFG